MFNYPEIKKTVKDGDKLLTEHNHIKGKRIVTIKGNGIILNNNFFNWDFFFEVNHPIKKLS
jgi:hypothetical protein